MWLLAAVGSAVFAGVVSILAKAGIRNTPSNVATAIRTVVVLVFAWVMVFVVGSQGGLMQVSARSLLFLVLSGLATGGSWLAYFHALQIGPVHRVVAVDKSSVVLTVLAGIAFFGETANLPMKLVGIAIVAAGTWAMLPRARDRRAAEGAWLPFSIVAAVFAALTTLLAKVGIADVESNLGTAIRTSVVLVMAWIVIVVSGEVRLVLRTPPRDLAWIAISGIATGASWLCFYRALQIGPVSGVASIDRTSVLVSALLAWLVFRERPTRGAMVGLGLILVGTLALVWQ